MPLRGTEAGRNQNKKKDEKWDGNQKKAPFPKLLDTHVLYMS
jgi:hypothetical protein